MSNSSATTIESNHRYGRKVSAWDNDNDINDQKADTEQQLTNWLSDPTSHRDYKQPELHCRSLLGVYGGEGIRPQS